MDSIRRLLGGVAVAGLLVASSTQNVFGEIAFPLVTAPAGAGLTFTAPNLYVQGPPYFLDDANDNPAVENDAVGLAVYTMAGNGASNGMGLSLSISNGENGMTSSEGGLNLDPNNTTDTNAAIKAVNGGGRLQNGNAVRFSLWMRQDPANPVTVEPAVECVVKFELWKQALSFTADYDPGQAFPDYGDRIWDQDQNAANATYNGFNQTQATWVDLGNDGTTSNPPGAVIGPSLVTNEWRRVVATMVIDDDPLNVGLEEGGWAIGGELFNVGHVEEIRAAVFMGDYSGTVGLDGSIWVDNLLFEVFADAATMNATAIPNPMPPEPSAGLAGDYNNDGAVDAADYTVWRNNLGDANETDLNNNGDGGDVGASDYTYWKDRYGDTAPGAGGLGSVVPEPTALVLFGIGALGAIGLRRRAA